MVRGGTSSSTSSELEEAGSFASRKKARAGSTGGAGGGLHGEKYLRAWGQGAGGRGLLAVLCVCCVVRARQARRAVAHAAMSWLLPHLQVQRVFLCASSVQLRAAAGVGADLYRHRWPTHGKGLFPAAQANESGTQSHGTLGVCTASDQ